MPGVLLVRIVVDGLATWRVAEMVVNESGPGNVLEGLRELTGIEHDADGRIVVVHNAATPLYCVLCASIWIAPLMGLAPAVVRRTLAVAAIAALVHKAVLRWL